MLNVVRGSIFAMLFALMLGAVVAYFTPAGSATDQPADLEGEIRPVVEGFFGAVLTGDPAKVLPILAPEFQIMRADGSTFDARGYAERGLPVLSEMPTIEKLHVTAHGDIAVATYYARGEQTRDGVAVESYAPRLTAFRKDGDRWLMIAHGNFAGLQQ